MAIYAAIESKLTVQEVMRGPLAPFVSAQQMNAVQHDALNESIALQGASIPAVTYVFAEQVPLTGSSGAATIDLTNLHGTNSLPIDGTGKKVIAVKFKNSNSESGAGAISIGKGVTNGYELAGANWLITLQPGQSALLYLASLAPVIDATHKTIDLTGLSGDVLDVILVLG